MTASIDATRRMRRKTGQSVCAEYGIHLKRQTAGWSDLYVCRLLIARRHVQWASLQCPGGGKRYMRERLGRVQIDLVNLQEI